MVVQRDEVNEPAVEWEEYEFADLCDITRGASPRPIHDWISVQGIPWLKIADASATQSRYITQTKERIRSEGIMKSVSVVPGDLILSNSATPGIPKFVGISACIHDGWLLLRNLRHLDKLYCYYLLLLERPRIVEQGSGTVFTNLKTDILKRHRVRVPPLPEQRAIAHILGTLDDKIELNRRMNETLEAMARALFKSWFVDFDPVRAKMEGRWLRGESLPGLPAEHYDLFPDRLVDSELGEIPEGWGVKALGEVAKQRRSGVKPEEIDAESPYIALEHMPKRCIALTQWSNADGLASGKFKFEQGDILFGKLRPYFHKVGVAPLDGVCSTDIVVVQPKSNLWFGFVLGHTSSAEFVDYTDATSTGTRMPRTNWADMARYKVVLPTLEVSKAFTGLVESCVNRIVSAIHESHTLAAQRDALLPGLVSGEVGVGDTEEFGIKRD